jgi:hypothetical protein
MNKYAKVNLEKVNAIFLPIPNQIKMFKKKNKYVGGKIVLKKKNKVIVSFLDIKNNRVEVEFVQHGRAA